MLIHVLLLRRFVPRLVALLVLPIAAAAGSEYGQTSQTQSLETPSAGVHVTGADNTDADNAREPPSIFAAPVPPNGRGNVFGLEKTDLAWANRNGRLSLLDYPAKETTVGAPYFAIDRLYGRLDRKPLLRVAMRRRGYSEVGRSWYDVYRQASLIPYPREEGRGAYYVPFPAGGRPATPMGFALFNDGNGVPVFSVSCASCHTRNLFGRPVMGGTNLEGGTTNSLLVLKNVTRLSDREYRFASHPSGGEFAAFHNMQYQLSFVQGKRAQAKGLENPVSFVGLSLLSRANDEFASRRYTDGGGSDAALLWNTPTDTKPPVLWNLRYKNRYQHDGSMKGDPMLANLIFNEIGRGADLEQLEDWIKRNHKKVRDLTAAGYAMSPPKWTDFFSPASIDLAKAMRGEAVFNSRCAECHGTYEKAWSLVGHDALDAAQLLRTTRVVMPEETVARNVGTDPNRSWAMVPLARRANRLRIFRNNGISFEAHPGAYVPPPLVGIWARWPYMHNNSIPNLDELLKPAAERVKAFYVGPAGDPRTDYDARAVGFPLGNKTPPQWRSYDRLFDTRMPGLSNSGHDEGIFVKDGVNQLSSSDKSDLIEYLKTL